MWITRAVAVAATSVAVAAVGMASPAQADPVMQGVYTYSQGDVVAEWTIYPSCVPTVGDLRENLELPVGCRLHVAPSSDKVRGGDAREASGKWVFSTAVKEGFQCPDGSWVSIVETYEFDDVAMSGTRSVANNDVCDGQIAANIATFPFTLTFKEPLPIPVQQQPLYCEPGGLKRCF